MSSRQLKKISGYNETEELKKSMGLVDGDEDDDRPVQRGVLSELQGWDFRAEAARPSARLAAPENGCST